MLDINKLTIGEIAKIEELSGQSITAMGDDDKPKGLTLAAMAFIAKRREDPSFTWNQAQEMSLEDVNSILGLAQEEEASDPLDGKASAPSKSTRRKS